MRWVEETGSTNADLLEAAARGEPDGVVLVADHQTAGRGRLDRTWRAPPGSSLLVSVLLRPNLGAVDAHLLTTAAGVAAVDACGDLTGATVGLKWPNDLVVPAGHRLAGRKLGGILAEARLQGPTVEAVVVGMGLNVEWSFELPPELAEVATALDHLGARPVEREDLLVAWLTRFDTVLADLDEPGGRDRLFDAVRRVSATIGRPVRAELPDGRALEGTAVDVAANGHLVVGPADGGPSVEIAVGDVVHLRQR